MGGTVWQLLNLAPGSANDLMVIRGALLRITLSIYTPRLHNAKQVSHEKFITPAKKAGKNSAILEADDSRSEHDKKWDPKISTRK